VRRGWGRADGRWAMSEGDMVVCQWSVCGVSVECLWSVCGVSVECLWSVWVDGGYVVFFIYEGA